MNNQKLLSHKNALFYRFISHPKAIYYIVFFNLFLRTIVAAFSNLGVDEVYYTLYAKYLDYSYFDHPPMVGWAIWLTTFGNTLETEFFVRLSAIILGAVNLILIYKIGCKIGNRRTGIIAALMFSGSFYASIIAGVFILPDTPQSFFWMLSLLFFIKFIKNKNDNFLLFFGVFVGLALLSKYHAVFLWIGAFIYLFLKEKKSFFNPKLYFSLGLSFIIFLPVLVWNFVSPYSGISYHENRVITQGILPNFKNFFPEFFGEIFYNNPFNVFLIVASLVILLRMPKETFRNNYVVFLLSTSLPLIFVVIFMSLYNKTLPHWSGPAYYSLILIASKSFSKNKFFYTKKLRISLVSAQILIVLVILMGLFQIKTGMLFGNSEKKTEELGKDDFTLDMAMWNTIAEELKKQIPEDAVIITRNWFPAAHLDFYFSGKNNSKIYVLGDRDKLHQYLKINKERGSISVGSTVFYITTSRYYQEPSQEIKRKFRTVSARKTIPIKNFHKTRLNVFIWKMDGLKASLN